MPNLLTVFSSIRAFGSLDMAEYSARYLNRVNSAGEQLEYYVRDAIAGSLMSKEKDKEYAKVYSYLGNQNNPPDIMIKGGDAFEIKKLQGGSSEIALNSSPPKDRLYSMDARITAACRNCEPDWKVKDMFYAIGQLSGKTISRLLFVHGQCYAADKQVYEQLHSKLKRSIEAEIKAKGLQGGETVELGRVNRVDPLGITELRVRGMWQMKNPIKFFEKELQESEGANSYVAAIMPVSKYNSFSRKEREKLKMVRGVEVRSIKLKNPNNPAKLVDGIVIKMVV